MIGYKWYNQYLKSRGDNLAQVRRNQSDMIINQTWTGDPTYKRAYVLTKNGWKWEDVKYQFHQSQSITRGNVDYYLQFRPGVHYPVGTYVLIPNGKNTELNLTQEELSNPFKQPIENRTQWWLIVARDNQNAYVRYNILRCEWNFRWIYNGKIENVFSVIRAANSYTSGEWRAEKTISLDDLTGFWAPDTHLVYGDQCEKLGLSDTRTIIHDQRFLLTTNDLYPKVYQVTKIVEVSPIGIYKYSIKQDEFNPKRDNVELQICDYYTNMGDQKKQLSGENLLDRQFDIIQMTLNENQELIEQPEPVSTSIKLGEVLYYQAKLGFDQVSVNWDVELVDDSGEIDSQEKARLEGLINLTPYSNNVVSVKPAKAHSLIGKTFKIIATGDNGNYKADIELEVESNET